MSKYLIQVSYGGEEAAGVFKEGGTGRIKASVKAIEVLGGEVESMYFAFGVMKK